MRVHNDVCTFWFVGTLLLVVRSHPCSLINLWRCPFRQRYPRRDVRQVLVFNCDEGIDFQSMGRIFIGLVKVHTRGRFPRRLSLIPNKVKFSS